MRTSWRMPAGAVLLLSWMSGLAEAQLVCSPPPVLPAPLQGPLTYSSPYGPRYATKDGVPEYQFHGGVDYSTGGEVGVPIYAVQGSVITQLYFQGPTSGGWILSIDGGSADPCPNAHFSYVHLFDNSSWTGTGLLQGCTSGPRTCPTTDSEGQPIYAMTSNNVTGQVITLEGTILSILGNLTSPTGQECYIEVFWINFTAGNPAYALSNCPGLPVGNPAFGIKTTNNVSNIIAQGEPIAVVGKSGAAAAAGAHLHLQVESGKQSPLAYVQHAFNSTPNYMVSFSLDQGVDPGTLDNNRMPLSGSAPSLLNPVNPGQYVINSPLPLVIRTDVDYSSTDDLDQLNIQVVQNGMNGPFSCSAGVDCFNYGGTGQGLSVSRNHDESLTKAVGPPGLYPHPHSNVFGQVNGGGKVSFLSSALDFTTLNPGSYLILVSAVDILGDPLQEPPIQMTIPPKLTVTVVGPGSVVSSTGGLNSGIDCAPTTVPPLTNCSDWFNISNGVTLTAVPLSTGNGSGSFLGWSENCTGTAATTITVFTPSPTPMSMTCIATFAGVTFTGDWNTTYGLMTLQQNGATVTGSYYSGNGTITGTVTLGADGDQVLTGTWSQYGASETGLLRFDLAPDGQSFSGTWSYTTPSVKAGGIWNGTRVVAPTGAGISITSASCTGGATEYALTEPNINPPPIFYFYEGTEYEFVNGNFGIGFNPPNEYTYQYNFTFSGTAFGPPSPSFAPSILDSGVGLGFTSILVSPPASTDVVSGTTVGSTDFLSYFDTITSSPSLSTSGGSWTGYINPSTGTSAPTNWTSTATISGYSAYPLRAGNFDVSATISWWGGGAITNIVSASATLPVTCVVGVVPAP